ncbi:MAG: V-type ATP synthase subunit I [Candidatus Woesearchaeota archaeon]|nr:V-type ATP synthase subunit I [Candidatus Woesearchaeota archaeon]
MFKVTEMSKIAILGPKTEMETVIKALYDLKICHIIEHKKLDELDIGSPLEKANTIARVLVKIRSICSYLSIDLKSDAEKETENADVLSAKNLEKYIFKLDQELESYQNEIKEANNELNEKLSLLKSLKELEGLDIDIDSFFNFESLSYFIGYVKKYEPFKKDLSAITAKFELKHRQFEKNALIALFIDKAFSEKAAKALESFEFKSIDISKLIGLGGKPSGHIKKLAVQISILENKKKAADKKTANMKKQNQELLAQHERLLSEELEKAEAPLKFGATESSFVISAWLPEKKLSKTAEILNKKAKNRIFIQQMPVGEKDNIPIKLKNPKIVKSFEFFMNLYSLPNYREIDPTFFIFLSFPLLFGFMLGDIGYGLTTLVIFWLLKKKFPKAKGFFNILVFASLATIFFGAIFGEFFGAEELFGWHLPRLISRNPEHELIPLMAFAVIVGIIHVNVGLAIGFANVLKAHGFKKAFMEKFGWFFLEAGAALLALSYTKIISISPFAGYILLTIAVIVLFLGEGTKGLVEIPSIFGNIFSYLRLMAIGLSSVGLAMVVNNMAEGFFHSGGFLIVVGILVLVIGHIINIGVGLLGSFLHSLRLHYVEFFTKFYEGGGMEFKPFGLKS